MSVSAALRINVQLRFEFHDRKAPKAGFVGPRPCSAFGLLRLCYGWAHRAAVGNVSGFSLRFMAMASIMSCSASHHPATVIGISESPRWYGRYRNQNERQVSASNLARGAA